MKFYELFSIAPSSVATILLLLPLPYWLLLYPLQNEEDIAKRYIKEHVYPSYIIIGIPTIINIALGMLGNEVSISDSSYGILLMTSVIVSLGCFVCDTKKHKTNIKVNPHKKVYVRSLLYHVALFGLACWEFIDPIIK